MLINNLITTFFSLAFEVALSLAQLRADTLMYPSYDLRLLEILLDAPPKVAFTQESSPQVIVQLFF